MKRKNMFSFTAVFVFINIFFLSVGALLYIYAAHNGITVAKTDYLYPTIALKYLGIIPGMVFMLGLTAATFATTDSALTALTTSFCVDFLNFNKDDSSLNSKKKVSIRHYVHVGFSFAMLLTIVIFNAINNKAVVTAIFSVASYTYGPLLGLYSFGLILKNRQVYDKLVPFICVISPAVCYYLSTNSAKLFGYTFDNELILVNGLITFVGLLIFSSPKTKIAKI
jgi:Na+/proline symporter